MPCKHILKIREIITKKRIYLDGKGERCKAQGLDSYLTLRFDSKADFNFLLMRNNFLKTEIKPTAFECNCEGNEDIKRLRNRISELESRVSSEESNSSTQLVLRRNTESDLSLVRTERNDLQVAKRSLESRNYDLERERNSLQSSNWSLQSTNSSLQNQLTQKDKDIEWGKGQLVIKEKEKEQIRNERDDYKNKWVLSDKEVKKITDSFNALQLEKTKKETEVISLQEELKDLQNIDFRYKKKKLDELTRNLGLDWEKVKNLREAYERLKKASDRENYNQDNITAAQTDINDIEREFFQTNVSVDDLHKLYKACEKMAELRVKQEKMKQQQQQQYQAQQEQPTK